LSFSISVRISFLKGSEPFYFFKIKKGLESKLNKKLKLVVGLDPGLLGGVQVTIGNTVIDGSVRRRLDDLKEKLETVRV